MYVNDSCWCCLNYTISSQDLEVKLEELKRILTVPKKTTSLYKRGLISVMDTRPAVVMTGSTLGAFILFLLAAFVIFADLQNFIRKRREET
ncbi:hypothetical protein FSP39_017735 [Pinctada imbricata]|uniref:Uncharacterized protein n=1 Tax=Pinctada imbricata TaxID=66713 RepID=A0AA88YJT1_PINIB|nr:hypothetical protein FSP39_017735 [Pinctada imbricata]